MSGAVEGIMHRIGMFMASQDDAALMLPAVQFMANPDHLLAEAIATELDRLTTPPARSYADEDVARIIDPDAWAQRERALTRKKLWERNPTEGMPDFVAIYAAGAPEQLVAPSLAKAAAIRLLSQGGRK